MDLSNSIWKYGGAIFIMATSSLIVVFPVMNVFAPMPFYLVILAWFTEHWFMAVTPSLYFIILLFSKDEIIFRKIIFYLTVFISILNFTYFYFAFSYGVTYQGLQHTIAVGIENLIGFSVVLVLAKKALVKSSRHIAYLANFILFFLLSWCAFPYLGELP